MARGPRATRTANVASPHVAHRFARQGTRSLTRSGWWVLGMSLVVAMVGVLRGDVWMYFIALLGMAAVVVSWCAVPRLPELEMRLVAPDVEIVGTPTFAQLVVHAGASGVARQHVCLYAVGDLPGDVADARPPGVHAVLEAMGPGAMQTVDLVLRPEIRGVHDGYVVRRWSGAPFGLVRRATANSNSRRRTIGAGLNATQVPAATRPGDGTDPRIRIGRDGADVHALRAWSTGDGSDIHWRTTARRNSPVVVDRETSNATGLVVVVGPAHGAEAADGVVSWAGGMARTAALDGADVHVVSSRGVLTLAPYDTDALLTWTSEAGPANADPAMADAAAQLAGRGGRVAVVHGRGGHSDVWAQAAAGCGAEVVDLVVDARPVVAAPEPPPPAFGRPLALATLLSLVGGLLCVTATGALTGPGPFAASFLLVALSAGALLRPPNALPARVRSAVSLVILMGTAALAVWLANDGGTSSAAAAVIAVCGIAAAQVIGARTRRDGLVALGLGPVLVVVAAGLAPSPALVLPALVVTVAVLLGLASSSAEGLADGVPGPHRGAPLRTAAPLTAVIVLGVTTFLLLPLGSGSSFSTPLVGDHQDGPPTAAQVAASEVPTYFSGVLDLSARGHLLDTTALEVASGAPPLWRAMTLDRVMNGVWTTEPVQQSYAAHAGLVTLPDDPEDSGAPSGVAQDFRVRPVDASSVVSPGPAVSVTGVDSVWQQQSNGFVISGALVPYTVSAVPFEDVDALRVPGGGRDRMDPVTVTPDPTTTERTAQLAARITAGLSDRVAMVQAVEGWLRANIRYQLDAPLPPDDQNAVDFLLFDSKAGFCEHFAAAEATMLRTLGIPARIATGYSATGGDVTPDGWRIVRDSDAHAWVEVWIPGHGWVTSDPTAGSALLDDASGMNIAQRVLTWWSQTWTSDTGRRALALAILCLTAVGVLVLLAWRRRRRAPRSGIPEGRRAAMPEPLGAFARHRSARASDGVACGPGDGVGEVRKASTGDAALLEALDVVERTLYDRTIPPSEERLAAADLLDRRTAELLGHGGAGREGGRVLV